MWSGTASAFRQGRLIGKVIDAKGKIAHVIDRPDVANHAEEVLALL